MLCFCFVSLFVLALFLFRPFVCLICPFVCYLMKSSKN